jgi:O-acetyl-ADP-ribose deacetylase (regulator of RNase III)
MQIAKFTITSTHPFRLIINKGSVTNFQHANGAIVNAANTTCLGGGGVDGFISAAGGKRLFKDREKLPEIISNGRTVRCPVGEAKITGPGNYNRLNVPYVIHAVGPSYWEFDNPVEADELLTSAYRQSLNRAEETELEAVAFCLLSAGIFRGSRRLDAVLRIALETICQFEGYKQLEEIHVFAFSEIEAKTILQVATTLGMERGA